MVTDGLGRFGSLDDKLERGGLRDGGGLDRVEFLLQSKQPTLGFGRKRSQAARSFALAAARCSTVRNAVPARNLLP